MEKAAKIFIIIGMVLQFFLVYPIIIGVLALKKIKSAKSTQEFKQFALIVTFFCSLLGGVFMLCIEDGELNDARASANEHGGDFACDQRETTRSTQSFSSWLKNFVVFLKKPAFVRIVGGVFVTGFLIAMVVLLVTSFEEIHILDDLTYFNSNFVVEYPYFVVEYSDFVLYIFLSVIFAVLATVVFLFVVFYKSSVKVWKRVVSACVMLVACASFFLFYSMTNNISVQKKIEYENDFRTPDYTKQTIAEFLSDAERYPSKYGEQEIKLEGYATYCKDDTFTLYFPEMERKNSICVKYCWDEEHPRVLNDDYVVVTGIVNVLMSEGRIEFEVIEATCEIKNVPRK